jgi:hypothetical protein
MINGKNVAIIMMWNDIHSGTMTEAMARAQYNTSYCIKYHNFCKGGIKEA